MASEAAEPAPAAGLRDAPMAWYVGLGSAAMRLGMANIMVMRCERA
jgi:hypothetical protein